MPSPPKSHYQRNEVKVYGLNAVLSVFRKRPESLIKLYLHKTKMKILHDVVQFCVKKRLAYKIVEDVELKRLTESVHHEGVCVIVKDRPSLTFSEFLKILKTRAPQTQILLPFLDGVQNPHNVGNILRACAHFGVEFVLLADPEFERLPPSARRVSEGGSEFVELVLLKNPLADLQTLQKHGYALLVTSSHASDSFWSRPLPDKTVLVLGGESAGVSPTVEKIADRRVLIPGSGHVESLNVASALAIFLAEFSRSKF